MSSPCRIPYDNLKALFIKSINYDRGTYRYYRKSIESILKMPIKDEAKVHAIWFMGIVYNNALNVESATETNGIVTEGLPIKISDLVKDKLNETSTDFTELLNDLKELLKEPVAADEADLSSGVSTETKGEKLTTVGEISKVNNELKEAVLTDLSAAGPKRERLEDLREQERDDILWQERGFLSTGTSPKKEEKPLTTAQKLNNIFTKLTKGSNATLNNLFDEFEDVINKDPLYDKSAKINAYNKFLDGISKLKNTAATSLRALIDQKKNELAQSEEAQSKLINLRSIPVLGEMHYVRKKNGDIKLLVFKNGVYFSYNPKYTGQNENVLEQYTVEPTDYITPVYGKDNLEVTNPSGSEFRLNANLAKNGVGFEDVRLYEEGIEPGVTADNRTGNQKISDGLSLNLGLTTQIKIVADRRRILANRTRIALLEEQGYDVDFENLLTPAQFQHLARNPNGGPVVTNLLPRSGVDVIISSNDNMNWDYMMSLDTLGFVYPDGTTRFIDWTSNEDLKLFREATRIKKYGPYVENKLDPENPGQSYTYEKPTDEELQNMRNIVAKIKEMKTEILDMMDDAPTLEIPHQVFSKYFNVSNVFSYVQSTKEQNGLYKPVQTLEKFKENLSPTNSLVRVRIAQFSAGKVIPSTIREESIIGIIKKDNLLGYTFEPSIEQGYYFIDENNNQLTYEQVFEAEGFSKEDIANTLKDPYIAKYGFFYLLRTKNNTWLPKPMYKNAPISEAPEIANFLSTLSALKQFRPSEFSEETAGQLNELIRAYNNFGWGFAGYKGINTNIDFIRMWQGESVYGIRFRASDNYAYADNFNKKNLLVEFAFDYDAIEKDLKVLYKELNINPNQYNSSVQDRLRFGNILQSKIEENKHLLSPAAIAALTNIEKEFKNTSNLLNKSLDAIVEKHNAETSKNPEAKYLENGRDIKFLLFRDLNTLEYKLNSKQKAVNPLLNYKVFEHNLNNSTRELIITPSKPSLGTDATVLTNTASADVKSKESAPKETSTRKIGIIRKKHSIASSLNGLAFVGGAEIRAQIDDVKRMLGASVTIDPTIISDRVESGYILGYFEENVITLNKLLPVSGVVYHEAFHAIFRLALTDEQRLNYLEAAKAILGTYKTDAGGKYLQVGSEKIYLDEFRKNREYAGVEDDIIVDYIYEEYLADGFRDYKLNKKEPKSKLIRVLYSLLDALIDLFKGKAYRQAKNQINRLYENIDKGKYADVIGDKYAAPRAYALSSVPSSIVSVGGEVQMDYKQVDNYTTDQLVDRLTREMLKRSGDIIKGNQASFDEVYDEITRELIKYFNVKNFITEDNPNAAEIIATYEPMFRNMRFMMGAAHRSDVNENFVLDNLTDDSSLDNYSFMNVEDADKFSYKTYDEIKNLVKKSYEGVATIRDITSEEDQAERDESDENQDDEYFERNDEDEVGEKYEDNGILTYKPYQGSAEFQKLIKYIKYTFVDERLGIAFDKMVNSREVINQIGKIAYNTPKENIVEAIYNHLEYLKDNIDKFNESGLSSQLGYIPEDMIQTIDDYNTMKAVYETLDEQAALNDNFLPTRAEGMPFYNMFLNVFYRANKNISAVSIDTKYENVTKEYREEADRVPVKNNFYVNSIIERYNVKIVVEKFRTNLQIGLESFKLESNLPLYAKLKNLVQNYNYVIPTNQETFDYEVNRLYTITSYANLNIPRNVIEFAVAASVRQAYKEKAPFVDPIIGQNEKFITKGNYFNIQDFVSKYNTVLNSLNKNDLSVQTSSINSFASEYEKIAPFHIKYDPSLLSNTVLNQDNKPINQSIPYVPSVQILNEIRWKGLTNTLLKYYGDVEFFRDNPILSAIINNTSFNPNDKSQSAIDEDTARIFFENFDISVAGGMLQEFGKGNRRQSTYRKLGDKGYALSVLGLFANRVSVTGNYGQEIIFFERPITQLEATSTQFNMTGLYEDYTNKKTREEKVKTKLKNILKQEYNRIYREWESKDAPKLRYEDYNCRTSKDRVVTTTDLKLRAYNFNRLKGFFNRDYELSYVGEDDNSLSNLQNILQNAAIQGRSFEDILAETYYDSNNNASEYTVDDVLSQALFEYGENQIEDLANYLESIDIQIDDIPSGFTLNGKYTSLTKYDKVVERKGDEIKEIFVYNAKKTTPLKKAFIEDFGYNFWFNSLEMNQLFDGDLAVGIKSIVNFFKRQKSGVIAGNNYSNVNIQESNDNSVFAVFKGLSGFLDSNNPSVPVTTDPTNAGDRVVKIADGLGWTSIDRRIKKFKKDGILSPELEALLKRLRYSTLTADEITQLNDNGIFLGSDKPAVGHPYFYYKDSEHYINRSDSSIVLDEARVAALYNELDALEMDDHTLNSDPLARHKEIVREIHKYFIPKKGREFNHHLLNALEYFKVDVAFDDTVTKKAVVQPLIINMSLLENNILEGHGSMMFNNNEEPVIKDGYINLSYNAHNVPNSLVYEQVSTTGISRAITDSIQKKLLLPAQLDPKKFPGAKKILDLQLDIVNSRLQLLERLFKTDDPKTLVTKAIQSGLMKQGAGDNLLEFFSLDKDGKNKFNLNLPILGKQPMFYFFSLFNNSVFGPKVAGKKFYHVSAAGYKLVVDENDNPISRRELDRNPRKYEGYNTRYPTVKEVFDENGELEQIVIEVIIPKHLASSPQEVEFFERLYTDFLAARIPTADKRSMVRAKVVDYIDASYGNSIIVPSQVHFWAGSDLDIDSLYAETYDYYRNTLGKLVKYGDYSGYADLGLSTKDAQFIEYLHYMATDPIFADLIDSEQDRINSDEEFKTRSLANAVGLFGNKVREFFSGTEEIVLSLLSKETFKELTKGKSVTLSIQTTGGKNKKKGTGLESLGQLMGANVVSSDKNLANILKLMDRLIAVVNVVNRYNLPSTPEALEAFTKKQGNPVHSKLHNEILKEKMDLLANPEVYETYIKNADGEQYINEYAADKAITENISDFIGIDKSDPYLFQTVGRVRSANNGTLDSVGANANNIKGATLLATANVKLSDAFTFNFVYNGKKINTKKPTGDSVQKIGGATDVSVDDAQHQNLGPLRISKVNSGIVGALYIYGYPSQFARLINSVDLIAKTVKEYSLNDDPSYSRSIAFRMGFGVFLNNKTLALVNANKKAFDAFGILKPSKNKINKFEIDHSKITIEFNDVTSKLEGNALSDFNITIKNNKGDVITGELGSIVLLSFFNEFSKVGNAISFKISKVTDVNKKLRPSFRTLSSIKQAVDFIEDNEIFENAKAIFKQYPYLEKLAKDAVSTMSTKSKEVLLDETILFNAFTSLFRYDKSVNIEDVTIELKSILALSSLNAYVQSKINDIDPDNMSSEDVFIQALHEATTMPYWQKNKIEKDLNILKRKFPKNEFLKALSSKPALYSGKGRTKVITSLIGSKLSIENQNRIINDFYQLLTESDESIYKMAVNVAVHGIVKDGGISRNGGFLKIIAPALFKQMSDRLNIIQSKLYAIDTQEGMTSAKYLKGLDGVFKDIYLADGTKGSAAMYTNSILRKLVSTLTKDATGNSALRLSFFTGNKEYLPGKYSDISLTLLKSIVDTILPKNAQFIYTTERDRRGNTKLVSVNTGLNTRRGLTASKTKFEFWKADENGELMFDLSQINDTNREVVNRLLLPQGIYQTRDGNYSFPLYQINNFNGDQVFLLTELDGKPFTEDFFKNLFDSYKSEDQFQFLLRGTTAKYKVIDRQGSDRISPNAFRNDVAIELKKHIDSTSNVDAAGSNIIQALPTSVKVIEGTTNLKIESKSLLNQVSGTKYTRNNQVLSIASVGVRYSARNGKAFMEGKSMTEQQLNEFANKLGFSSFEEATKNSEFNTWLSSKTISEYWLLPYTADNLTSTEGQDMLYGLEDESKKELEFHINTLNVVSGFLENIGVEQRMVPEFLRKDGSVIQGALAAANFLEGTVDVIEDMDKRLSAWNRMPEEAAHWWYRLLKTDSQLKKALWESAKTSEKLKELLGNEYGEFYDISKLTPDALNSLKEESIGQLIAEAIKRIEEKNAAPEDYSFLQKFIKWVNKLLIKFQIAKIQEDPFDIAAMKILSSDLTDLMTLSEYREFTKNIKAKIHSGEVFDENELDTILNENLKEKHKYVYKISDVGDQSSTLKNYKIVKEDLPFESKGVSKAYSVYDDSALGIWELAINKTFYTRKEAKAWIAEKNKIESITTFRKNNPKLDIDRNKYKKENVLILNIQGGKKGVFIRSSRNDAFRDFFYFLDYKNKVVINKKTYYFLTDKYELGTESELRAKRENIIARKKAAKEGRYTIKPVKNPRLSPRLKREFLEYVENLRSMEKYLPEFEERITSLKNVKEEYNAIFKEILLREHKQQINNLQKDSPEIRQKAIDSLIETMFERTKYNPAFESLEKEYRSFLESLPTFILVNINLNPNGIESPLDYLPKIEEYNPFVDLKNNFTYAPNVGISASLPEGYEEEIAIVNKQIVDNKYNNNLTSEEKQILGIIGVGSARYKSKGIAVLIEVYKKYKRQNKYPLSLSKSEQYAIQKAKEFFKKYRSRRLSSQYLILDKLMKSDAPEFDVMVELARKFRSINEKYDETVQSLNDVIDTTIKKGISTSYIDPLDINIFKDNVKESIAFFIYNMSRYSPQLSSFMRAMDLFIENSPKKNIILSYITNSYSYGRARGDQFNYDLYARIGVDAAHDSAMLKFAAFYDILTDETNSIHKFLKSNDPLFTDLLSSLGMITDFYKTKETKDILKNKLDSIYEYIKSKEVVSLSVNARPIIYDAAFGYDLAEMTQDDNEIDGLILMNYPIQELNERLASYARRNSVVELASSDLPEGIDFGQAEEIDLRNAKRLPRDFKFSHRLQVITMPQINLADLPTELKKYIQENEVTATLKDYKKKPKVRTGQGIVDSVTVSKTKSMLLSNAKSKYSFDHIADLYYDQLSFPYYSLGMPGNKFKIEFSAPENSPFPSKLYEKFKLHHGSMRMVSSNAIGWFSGKFTDTALYVTEIQSDLLQRTYELSEKYLDKNGYHADHPFRQFTQYKSKLENYYDGWLYVFAGTGLAMMLKNNPSIEKIFIPTSDYYENSVSRNSPYQYYDKLALLYPNAVLTEDGKFWEINRSDIYSENTNQKSMYDSIIKAAVVAGTKAQKEATPDLDSDRNLAFDVLNSLNDLGILSEYLNSNEGKKHLEEIREWITGRFLDEKPFTDDTPGGELQLVDPQGNPIDDEDMQEDEELEQLLRSSDKKIKLDVNQLLDDLQDALKAKDVNKQNFIKKLLDEANGYGNSDILYALSKPVDKPTESFDESDNSDPFC